MTYDVAISFAGEQRAEARAIAKCLTNSGLKVFFDEYEDAMLWGEDLYERLSDVYQNQASYCITLVSKEYAEKIWTSHERKNAQARALKESEAYILPVRFDNTEIPGLAPTIGYLDFAKYGHEGICNAFLRKLGRTPSPTSSPAKSPAISRSNYAFIHPTESGQWLFVPVKKCRWSPKEISMSVEPEDPTDGPILTSIKIGSKVLVGYEFDVAQCRLVDRTQISEGANRQWDLILQIEEINFSPTFEINFGASSANELAEKRARRILLNEDPATETRDINKALIEHYTAGQGTPLSIKKSILPELFKQYGGDIERFLAIAWICAIALLKLSGAVADVQHLELTLETGALDVEFCGRRRKEYVNQPAYEIVIKGKCPLTGD
jgi:hypothetical protein